MYLARKGLDSMMSRDCNTTLPPLFPTSPRSLFVQTAKKRIWMAQEIPSGRHESVDTFLIFTCLDE